MSISVSKRLKLSAALSLAALAAVQMALVKPAAATVVTDTWSGAGTGNWADAGNWSSGNNPPTAAVSSTNADALLFNGSNVTNNNTLAANTYFNGITFNNGSSSFNLSGNSIVLSGNALATAIGLSNPNGATNGITNRSTNAETLSNNLTLDWGLYTFSNATTGTLALNGTLTANNGGIAWFNPNGASPSGITSTSYTLDASGLISGLGGAGLYGKSSDGFANFSGLATVGTGTAAGTIVPYTYTAANIIAAPGTIGTTTAANAANIELTGTA
ncbi:MAG TPA: hypothetical protein VKJ65_10755, partial [Phycisphaerae bacterium]|nr:hypothetical protein [Phycisphaerae bacterium]